MPLSAVFLFLFSLGPDPKKKKRRRRRRRRRRRKRLDQEGREKMSCRVSVPFLAHCSGALLLLLLLLHLFTHRESARGETRRWMMPCEWEREEMEKNRSNLSEMKLLLPHSLVPPHAARAPLPVLLLCMYLFLAWQLREEKEKEKKKVLIVVVVFFVAPDNQRTSIHYGGTLSPPLLSYFL